MSCDLYFSRCTSSVWSGASYQWSNNRRVVVTIDVRSGIRPFQCRQLCVEWHSLEYALICGQWLLSEIRKRKFGWIGHTLRKDDSEPCKAALQWNPQGTRGKGRPRNSWWRITLNESGKHSWSDLRFIVRSREGWRRFVELHGVNPRENTAKHSRLRGKTSETTR
jgi:hypothetical protein